MNGKLIFIVVIPVALAAIGYFGWKLTARGAYESAEYQTLESDGQFEIREYPRLMMATTSMSVASQGDDGSFMRLFGYISGSNDQEQKVAMTTPVFMGTAAEDEQSRMSFVLPQEIAEQQIPQPSNEKVKVRERAEGKYAVIRFAGRSDTKSVAHAEQKLREWIAERGLNSTDDLEVAGYDPPWTPGPLRRNEVLIRLR